MDFLAISQMFIDLRRFQKINETQHRPNGPLNFDNVIYERPQQADPREKKREDQAWHQFRKCDFPVFPEKMEIVRGPNDGKKKRRDASLAV